MLVISNKGKAMSDPKNIHIAEKPLTFFPRSQAPASGRLLSREAGASPASAFPSRGLGTRKKILDSRKSPCY